MVFDLVSNITSRKTVKHWKINSKLYQPEILEVLVLNPYNQDAEFKITL